MPEQRSLGTRVKPLLDVDGLTFKDLNGNGVLDPYEDWRLSPEERAADLVSRMSPEEKAGLMVIGSRPMGYAQKDRERTSHDGALDEEHYAQHFSGNPDLPGTTEAITERHMRHFIVRETPTGERLATWVDALNEVAEGTRLGIPVLVASNSRNERGGFMLDARPDDQPFTQWPGTLGLAATGDLDLISDFAAKSRAEWNAAGIRKGYMYMADVATDPRWFRTNGTFGEDPAFIAAAITRLVQGFQGEEWSDSSIALTTKHFPGGGARENGFDPHYAEGKYNCYPTPGSLETYHLPPFRAAVRAGTSSVMPYYAIPSNEKSAIPQAPFTGEFEEVGFAFNDEVLRVLREDLGHTGYVNSDSGVLARMAWGVEDLDPAQRVAKGVGAGVDIFADVSDPAPIKEALLRGLVTEAQLDASCRRLLVEMFRLGLFEDPYRDPAAADAVILSPEHRAAAYAAHQRSVVALKNTDTLLPLTPDRLAGRKVYVELFEKDLLVSHLDDVRDRIAALDPTIRFTTDYHDADVAVLFLKPSSGAFFEATPDYLDLAVHEETNVAMAKVRRIREAVPRLVVSVNVVLPWLLDEVEPLADALVASFDTYETAVMDVVCGRAPARGHLPLTLPAGPEAIAVDEHGICASPNDVPGYDKERYMDGRRYAYVDAAGNTYRLGFGLEI